MEFIKKTLKTVFLHSVRRTVTIVFGFFVLVSLPVTLILLKQQQDLRQRASGLTFNARVNSLEPNQEICGGIAEKFPFYNGDFNTKSVLYFVDESKLFDTPNDIDPATGDGGVSFEKVYREIAKAQAEALKENQDKYSKIADKIKSIPLVTTAELGDLFAVSTITGNYKVFTNQFDANNFANNASNLIQDGMLLHSLHDQVKLQGKYDELIQDVNGAKSIDEVNKLLEEYAKDLQGISQELDDFLHVADTGVLFKAAPMGGGQYHFVYAMDTSVPQIPLEDYKFNLNGMISTLREANAGTRNIGQIADAVDKSLSGTKAGGFFRIIKNAVSSGSEWDAAMGYVFSEMQKMPVSPGQTKEFFGCSRNGGYAIEALVYDEKHKVSLYRKTTPQGYTCIFSNNGCVTFADLNSTTDSKGFTYACTGIKKDEYRRIEPYTTEFQYLYCPYGKECRQLSNGISCVDSAPTPTPYQPQQGPAIPNCAQAYGDGYTCQNIFTAACTSPNLSQTSQGTTCDTHDGANYCCAPQGTKTISSTAPSVPGPIIVTACENGDPGSLKFEWTRNYSGYNYELGWNPGGNVVTVGDQSYYNKSGFAPGLTISYYIRSVISNTGLVGQSTRGEFTIPTSCESGLVSSTQSQAAAPTTVQPTPATNSPGGYQIDLSGLPCRNSTKENGCIVMNPNECISKYATPNFSNTGGYYHIGAPTPEAPTVTSYTCTDAPVTYFNPPDKNPPTTTPTSTANVQTTNQNPTPTYSFSSCNAITNGVRGLVVKQVENGQRCIQGSGKLALVTCNDGTSKQLFFDNCRSYAFWISQGSAFCQSHTSCPSPTITPLLSILTPTKTPLSCDANRDGVTNNADYDWWLQEFTGQKTTTQADCNHDGKVDVVDFNIWRDVALLHINY